MNSSRIAITAALAAAAFWAHSAGAFTVDDRSMNSPSAAANFSDPDEKTPGPVFTIRGGSNQFSGNGSAQGQNSNLPPSAVAPAMVPFPPYRQ